MGMQFAGLRMNGLFVSVAEWLPTAYFVTSLFIRALFLRALRSSDVTTMRLDRRRLWVAVGIAAAALVCFVAGLVFTPGVDAVLLFGLGFVTLALGVVLHAFRVGEPILSRRARAALRRC